MRHYLSLGAVAAHPLGMLEAALSSALVASARAANRLAPGRLRALVRAIVLATVAGAANAHLRAASCAQEESGNSVHRLAPSSRTKMDSSVLRVGYSQRIPCSGMQGATQETWPFRVSRPPLRGNTVLPFRAAPVILVMRHSNVPSLELQTMPLERKWRAMSSGRTTAGPRLRRGARRHGPECATDGQSQQRRLQE